MTNPLYVNGVEIAPAFTRLCRFIARKKGGTVESVAASLIFEAVARFQTLPTAAGKLAARRAAGTRYCNAEALDPREFYRANFEAWCDAKLTQLRREWR